jgi:DNA-binding transcriptional MerR regulator
MSDFMEPGNVTFTRSQLGDLVGLDETTLNYWARENLIRAAGGGGGKGQHRRFDFYEVNLAAILHELSKFGVALPALRGLADRFHVAIDFMNRWGITSGNIVTYGDLIGCRDEAVEHGDIELSEDPGRRVSWLQLIALKRQSHESELITDLAIACAEETPMAAWLSIEPYLKTIGRVSVRAIHGRRSPKNLTYFIRNDDGEWSIAEDDAEASEHVSFIGIYTQRLLGQLWATKR